MTIVIIVISHRVTIIAVIIVTLLPSQSFRDRLGLSLIFSQLPLIPVIVSPSLLLTLLSYIARIVKQCETRGGQFREAGFICERGDRMFR